MLAEVMAELHVKDEQIHEIVQERNEEYYPRVNEGIGYESGEAYPRTRNEK